MKATLSNKPMQIRLAIVMAACFALPSATTEGQGRGFRIGNVIQAGGGQGFRIGGPRGGMHFGGGQGTTIGTQRFGMRFGNGQGARFGGVNYGMQFGGGQGTQFGRFSTTPGVQPGTYYYQNGMYYPTPGSSQVIGQQNTIQRFPQPATQSPPLLNSPPSQTGQPSQGLNSSPLPTSDQPTTNQTVPTDQNGNSVLETTTGAPKPLSSVPKSSQQDTPTTRPTIDVNLRYPQTATQNMVYRMNGTTFSMKPGQSINMSGNDIKIEFPAGPGLVNRQAILTTSGDYFFQQQPAEGWMLMRENVSTEKSGAGRRVNENERAPKIAPAVLDSDSDSDDALEDQNPTPPESESPGKENNQDG